MKKKVSLETLFSTDPTLAMVKQNRGLKDFIFFESNKMTKTCLD